LLNNRTPPGGAWGVLMPKLPAGAVLEFASALKSRFFAASCFGSENEFLNILKPMASL
jgi:hypothetical protein